MSKFHHFGIAGVARLGMTLVIVLCAAVLSAQAVFAAGTDSVAETVNAQANNFRCIKGLIIDHAENPITDGWVISATPRAPDGSLLPSQTISTTSDSNGEFEFPQLIIATWNFSLTVKSGWVPITPANFDVTLDYSTTGCQLIRFKLRQLVKVNVLKIDDNHTPLPDWLMCAEPEAGNFFAEKICLRTGADGYAHFELTPGNWLFIESAPTGVAFIPVMPPSDRQSLNVQPLGPYTLRFKNVTSLPKGCIEVFKYDSPPDDQEPFPLSGWQIDVLRADGSVAGSTRTDAFGKALFCNLLIGPYTVIEEVRKAWKPASDSRFEVIVATGETISLAFYNKQDRGFCFEGYKIDDNGYVGIPGWTILATPVAVGGVQPDSAVTDGLGYYRICLPRDDYRIPGASYKICEEMQAGWLSHTATCYVATLPQYPDAPVRVPDFVNQQVGHWESLGGGSSTTLPGCRLTHTVKPGEYLGGIAMQYGVGMQALLNANPLISTRWKLFIKSGESICIP